jgi:hypothetical protein
MAEVGRVTIVVADLAPVVLATGRGVEETEAVETVLKLVPVVEIRVLAQGQVVYRVPLARVGILTPLVVEQVAPLPAAGYQ